jgi:hypothetical protein
MSFSHTFADRPPTQKELFEHNSSRVIEWFRHCLDVFRVAADTAHPPQVFFGAPGDYSPSLVATFDPEMGIIHIRSHEVEETPLYYTCFVTYMLPLTEQKGCTIAEAISKRQLQILMGNSASSGT